VYRRKGDGDTTTALVDIGSAGTRVVISRGPQILFARSIPIGGDTFTRATAEAMKMTFDDAKLLRIRLANLAPQPAAAAAAAHPEAGRRQASEPAVAEALAAATGEAPAPASVDGSFALLDAAMARARKQDAPAPTAPQAAAGDARRDPNPADERELLKRADQACRDAANKLVEEIDLCRRYYEATFPGKPVDRLMFVGGEARQRALCMHVARELGVAAQVGDPLVRMNKTTEVGIESGIDRRQPQPAWAVAVGLSIGTAGAASAPPPPSQQG
jgi:Tfp pilus assembly PilM family ATPase